MAGRGRPPKAPEQRRRTNAEVRTELDPSLTVEAPGLPGADRLSALTVRWYETWCSSPQAQRFVATDWQRLHMLAPLVDEYWREPSTKTMSEIRLNESLLGATEVDRMRLRWDVSTKDAKPESIPKSRSARSGLVVHEGGAAVG